MIAPRSPLARLSAALAAACLLLTFAACLSVCSEHVGEVRGGGADAAAVDELCATHCEESCPVTGSAAPLPAKRFAPDPPSEGAQSGRALASHEPPDAAIPPRQHPDALRPPDPPFERLRALRI